MDVGKSGEKEKTRMAQLLERVIDLPLTSFNALSRELGQGCAGRILSEVRSEMHK